MKLSSVQRPGGGPGLRGGGGAGVRFFGRAGAGEVFLAPANAAYEPIPVTAADEARVMGKVVTVLRQIR